MSTAYHPVEASTGQGKPDVVVNVVHLGDNKRTAYWWEAGPVDTCCCCFSLRTGVGILATLDILALGAWVPIFIILGAKKAAEVVIAGMEEEYTSNCEGPSPTESEDFCLQLAENIGTLRDSDDGMKVPVVLYVRAALSMVAGAIGLWAFFGSYSPAAKLYLWTWAPRYLVVLATEIAFGASSFERNILWRGFRLLLFAYYLKVVWSYQEVLKRRSLPASSSEASQTAGGFELNTHSAEDDVDGV